ncbi:MAG: hypothetical protein IJW00_05710 [Clostridia bacterium]|nr:hypothetical protein [Clostridia bacterium]
MYKRVKENSWMNGVQREYADIYVENVREAKTVDTNDYIQGSKLYVIETAQLYVLSREGGVWRNASNGSVLQ